MESQVARQSAPDAAPTSPPPVALSADPFAAIIAITVVMSVIVLAKIWAKVVVIKQFGLDDWSALIGSLFVIAETGVLASILRDSGLDSANAVASPLTLNDPSFQGVGSTKSHTNNLRLTNPKRLFVLLILAGVPLAFAKLSILFLLLKIFPRHARPITAYFIWAAIAFAVLYYGINVLYIAIRCGPRLVCPGVENLTIGKVLSIANLALDIYMFVLAAVNVWTLQMSNRLKVGVTAIFATGFLALAASAIVLYFRVYFPTDPNEVWIQILTPTVLLQAIYEPAIALITACLPTIPSLWNQILKAPGMQSLRRLFSRTTQGREPENGSFELLPNNTSANSINRGEYSLGNSIGKTTLPYKTDAQRLRID
ncbi:hypothetical protein NPX13_g3509 [Xylaria arbuscula]|uniref:Rhodopsin domain-containing protein n=1 Tax=Xylaria arbuscula TaxID=114810 RepID=A0A9W8TPH4_9PEZI|nr:hypothetical protein NPX13_g3509 [Xylaria arbuscula]